jgi:hypothetical protein
MYENEGPVAGREGGVEAAAAPGGEANERGAAEAAEGDTGEVASAMCVQLEEMMTGASTVHNGAWGVHHEQSEMSSRCWGQYAHNNQPVHHVPYMFSPAGCRSRGEYWIRQILQRLYTTNGSFVGDEDGGEMCAWWVDVCGWTFFNHSCTLNTISHAFTP